MKHHEGKKQSGLFQVPGHGEAHGEVTLDGSNTLVALTAKDFLWIADGESIVGTLHDLTKVSLIKCVSLTSGSVTRDGEQQHYAHAFPHFVVFGNEHLTATDESITSVHFLIDDAATLFYDFDAFGNVISHKAEIVEAILREKVEHHSRKIEFGEDPELFYFTGKREIFSVETRIGKISATHTIGYQFPGPEGFHLKNRIFANIEFPNPVSISTCTGDVLTLLRFFEIIVGRPQNILDLQIRLTSPEERPVMMDVYWSMPPKREEESHERRPHPADSLMDAAGKPEAFGRVLANWLRRHAEWRDARFRFSSAFSELNKFSIDRLVGAANMFDILPGSTFPAPSVLSAELLEAKKKCRDEWLKLPDSPERGSILGALGRLGKNTLKQKIRSRARLITDATGTRFPDLDIVVNEAVNCRNYFVHGTESNISYSDNSDFLSFFTLTLEFIFAASDLVEAGWDIEDWCRRDTTMSHPFGRYLVEYPAAVTALTSLLNPTTNDS